MYWYVKGCEFNTYETVLFEIYIGNVRVINSKMYDTGVFEIFIDMSKVRCFKRMEMCVYLCFWIQKKLAIKDYMFQEIWNWVVWYLFYYNKIYESQRYETARINYGNIASAEAKKKNEFHRKINEPHSEHWRLQQKSR